jgi:hypothetical protein
LYQIERLETGNGERINISSLYEDVSMTSNNAVNRIVKPKLLKRAGNKSAGIKFEITTWAEAS